MAINRRETAVIDRADPKVRLANAEYEERRALRERHHNSVSVIERKYRLRPRQLKNYRANYISRGKV